MDCARDGKVNGVVNSGAGCGKTFTAEKTFSVSPFQRMGYGVYSSKNRDEALQKINNPKVEIASWHQHGLRSFPSRGFRAGYAYWEGRSMKIEHVRINQVSPKIPFNVLLEVETLVSALKNNYVQLPTISEAEAEATKRDIAPVKKFQAEFPTSKLAEIAVKVCEMSLTPRKDKLISFDDMVWVPVVNGWVKPRFDMFLGDEFQDLNRVQLAIFDRITSGQRFMFGDDFQCIYEWRGAYANSLKECGEKYNARLFTLSQTQRCPKVAVKHAATFKIGYVARDNAPEGVEKTLGLEQALKEIVVGEAILSRLNAPLVPIFFQLLREGKTARIEGKDIGAKLCKTIENLTVETKPGEHWQASFETAVNNWYSATVALTKNQDKVATIRDNADTLIELADGCNSTGEVCQRIKNIFFDTNDDPKPAIVLSSVHKAKGLEWPGTYLIESSFRHSGTDRENEENRIRYVALTRTKNKLVFVQA